MWADYVSQGNHNSLISGKLLALVFAVRGLGIVEGPFLLLPQAEEKLLDIKEKDKAGHSSQKGQQFTGHYHLSRNYTQLLDLPNLNLSFSRSFYWQQMGWVVVQINYNG